MAVACFVNVITLQKASEDTFDVFSKYYAMSNRYYATMKESHVKYNK